MSSLSQYSAYAELEEGTERGLERHQAEILSDLMGVIYNLDRKKKINERQLRRMIYHAGVFLYRAYNKMGKPDDNMFPSVHHKNRLGCLLQKR